MWSSAVRARPVAVPTIAPLRSAAHLAEQSYPLLGRPADRPSVPAWLPQHAVRHPAPLAGTRTGSGRIVLSDPWRRLGHLPRSPAGGLSNRPRSSRRRLAPTRGSGPAPAVRAGLWLRPRRKDLPRLAFRHLAGGMCFSSTV